MNEPSARQAAADQFNRQSERYGKSHILADTGDVLNALQGIDVPSGGKALDVATGGGHTALCLAGRGWRVTAGDIAQRMLDNANKLLAEHGYPLETRLFPAEDIPFPAQSFQLIASRVAPHHFVSPPKFVSEVARVLEPGGHFLLIDGSVPDDDTETEEWLHQVEKWRDPSHGRYVSRKAWEKICTDAGLKVVLSELQSFKQPDLEWYFDTAATSAENRKHVLQSIAEASSQVRKAIRLGTENGKIIWWWPRLTLLCAKPTTEPR